MVLRRTRPVQVPALRRWNHSPATNERHCRACRSAIAASAGDLRLDHRAGCRSLLDQRRIDAAELHLRAPIPARFRLAGLLAGIHVDEPLRRRALRKRAEESEVPIRAGLGAQREVERKRVRAFLRWRHQLRAPALQTKRDTARRVENGDPKRGFHRPQNSRVTAVRDDEEGRYAGKEAEEGRRCDS
jgi:hypothetical protein